MWSWLRPRDTSGHDGPRDEEGEPPRSNGWTTRASSLMSHSPSKTSVVADLRARGAELVGELERYEDSYRLCYVRGPEGIIVELAEQIS